MLLVEKLGVHHVCCELGDSVSGPAALGEHRVQAEPSDAGQGGTPQRQQQMGQPAEIYIRLAQCEGRGVSKGAEAKVVKGKAGGWKDRKQRRPET